MNKPKPSPRNTSFFYLGLSLLAFFPCLFQGQAYFDNDLLAQFGPWRAFLKDQLAQGHFPLWDPYHLGGQPFFADPQTMMLSPFNWLTLPFPLAWGLGLFFALHFFWAAWGMDRWLEALGLSSLSRSVGATAFALSGFFWLEIIHPPVVAALAWLPWLFFCLERLARDPKGLRGFWTGLVFANLFLCGSPQMTLGALYAGIGYFLWRSIHFHREALRWPHGPSGWRAKKDPRPGKKKDGKALSSDLKKYLIQTLFILWGALPLLAQAIPTGEFISRCDRGTPGQTYEQADSRLPLDPSGLYQFFLPRFGLTDGRPMAEAIQFGNTNDDNKMAANLGYLGIWAPFLAFWAFRGKDRGVAMGLGAWGLLGLLLSLGRYTPLHRILCQVLPGLSYVHVPYRFLFLYILPLASLTAFGFEKVFGDDDKRTPFPKPVLYSGLTYGLFLYVVALWRPTLDWRELVALGLVMAGFLLAASKMEKALGGGKKWVVLGLVLPLLLSGWDDFKPDDPSNFDYLVNSGELAGAAKPLGQQRAIFYNNQMGYPVQVNGRRFITNYPQNCCNILGIKNWGGYDPLVLKVKREIGSFPLKAQLQLGAIGGVFSQGRLAPIPGFVEEKLGPYYFYRHQPPMPLAYAPSRALVELDPVKRLAYLEDPSFDAGVTALFSDPGFESGTLKPYPKDPHFECDLIEDGTDHLGYKVTKRGLGPVVFCQVMYPGWKATLDGHPVPLYTADHFLRCVLVPDGEHRVAMDFEPEWWFPILKGLGFWFFLTMIGIAWALQKRERNA